MRLPAGLQTKHVAGNFAVAQALSDGDHLVGVGLTIGAIPEAQSPFRRSNASAGKQVVAPDGVDHRWSGEEIHVHTLCAGNLDSDDAGSIWRKVARGARCCRT